MFENDPDLLLKFAACCKIILGGTVDVDSLPRAQQLLEEYLAGFLENHPSLVKPNFHYVTHIFQTIRDFGPVYGFWTFLVTTLIITATESLRSPSSVNSTATPNCVNLQLERLAKKESTDGLTPEEQCAMESARTILATDGDQRGTVASMANEVEELSADLDIRFSLGLAVTKELPVKYQNALLEYYNTTYPDIPIVARDAVAVDVQKEYFLHASAQVHPHVILDGRRVTSSTSLTQASSSIVQLDAAGTRYVGQVFDIITHRQPGVDKSQHLLYMGWMRRFNRFDMSPWDPYPELEVFAWEHGQFLRRGESGPPRIVPVSSIHSQACRLTVNQKAQILADDDGSDSSDEGAESSDEPARKIWFTAGLSRDVAVV
ncbi:alcohol dehydrogenase [Favolaschia claudopus]|uniref:Alcohol dehydrogenase n=1 Tax=Favolaschia claudopus TaxID=2862362 RepID=A0AAV9ZXR6_9AGAR